MLRRNTALLLILALSALLDVRGQENINGKPIRIGMWKGVVGKYLAGEIVIKITPNANRLSVDSVLKVYNLHLVTGFDKRGWGVVSFDTSVDVFQIIHELSEYVGLIEYAGPSGVLETTITPPNDSLWPMQRSLHNLGDTGYPGDGPLEDADIDCLETWDSATGNPSLIIGVLDSGIELDSLGNLCHVDLSDSSRFQLGWNCIVDSCVSHQVRSVGIDDFFHHGTRMTGIIAAQTNNYHVMAGIVWNCKVLVMKAVDQNDRSTIPIVSRAIEKACDSVAGAKIQNLSLTGYTWQDSMLEAAVDSALRTDCMLICSVGNEPGAHIGFPAAYASWGTHFGHYNGYRNVLAVSATDWRDSFYNVSYSDSVHRVTVTAPGFGPSTYTCPNGFIQSGFTSGATAHVTGVASLIRSRYSSISAESTRTIIENTADKIWHDPDKEAFEPAYLDSLWHPVYGFGRVNAYRAVAAKTLKRPKITSITVQRDAQNTTHWIALAWDDSSNDESLFRIYRRSVDSDPRDTVVSIVNPNVTTFSDSTPLVGSQDYYYRVTAYESVSQSGGFSKPFLVHNIPNPPTQNYPIVLSGPIDECCPGFGEAPCPTKSNKVIVSWNAPTNQKANTLVSYLIKANGSWFVQPATKTQDTICLDRNTGYTVYVYSLDGAGDTSHASNSKTLTTGNCNLCIIEERVWLPHEDFSDGPAEILPVDFSLAQNYPNPFNVSTQIRYALPEDAEVIIEVFNILGQKVKQFNLGKQNAGYKSIIWDGKTDDGKDISSGIYLYRIKAGDYAAARRMTFLK